MAMTATLRCVIWSAPPPLPERRTGRDEELQGLRASCPNWLLVDRLVVREWRPVIPEEPGAGFRARR
jgi:hypothetical protein